MPYSQKNNPIKMMKSSLKKYKDDKKQGMHRDSAMYMKHGMHRDSSMYMKNKMNSPNPDFDMPVVDIEKGDAKADRKDARKEQPKSKREYGSLTADRKDARKEQPKSKREYGSPAMAAKPDFPDIDGDGNTTESMKKAAADKKGSPAKKEGMSKKEAKDLGRMIRTAQGKATKKDERKNKRDTKKTMRHVKKHGSGLKMD